MWKQGKCDKCGTEGLVKRSRGKSLCRECFKEAKKKAKMEDIRRGER